MKLLWIFSIIYFLISICYGLNPVILVPGDGGSHLQAMYTSAPPHLYCGFKNRWFTLWLNLYLMTPLTLDCFVETVKLNFNSQNQTTEDQNFCDVRAPGFGTVDTIEYLTTFNVFATAYFHDIIELLETKYGYTRNVNILGAPFDFRKAPNEQSAYFKSLVDLIIEAYQQAGQQPVILIGHSLGTLQIALALNRLPVGFKDKYIKTFISISGPYGGALDAVRTALSGNNEHIPILRPLLLRDAQSSWPSTYYLMPNKQIWANRTMVMTKTANYTISSLHDLLVDSGIPNAAKLYKATQSVPTISAPDVTTYCIYGNTVPTSKLLDYRNVNYYPDDQPDITYGLGDGTVNLASLQVCDNWANHQQAPVSVFQLGDTSHLDIMRDNRLIKVIDQIFTSLNQ